MSRARRPGQRQERPSESVPVGRNEKYYSKVVGKALDILQMVQRSPSPPSLNELTRQVRMAESSVFRILHTLEVCGCLRKNESGQYLLSGQVQPWVSRYSVDELLEAANPWMWELRRRFTETVNLGALFDNHIEIVAVYESPQLIRMGNTVGRVMPQHASSQEKPSRHFSRKIEESHCSGATDSIVSPRRPSATNCSSTKNSRRFERMAGVRQQAPETRRSESPHFRFERGRRRDSRVPPPANRLPTR